MQTVFSDLVIDPDSIVAITSEPTPRVVFYVSEMEGKTETIMISQPAHAGLIQHFRQQSSPAADSQSSTG